MRIDVGKSTEEAMTFIKESALFSMMAFFRPAEWYQLHVNKNNDQLPVHVFFGALITLFVISILPVFLEFLVIAGMIEEDNASFDLRTAPTWMYPEAPIIGEIWLVFLLTFSFAYIGSFLGAFEIYVVRAFFMTSPLMPLGKNWLYYRTIFASAFYNIFILFYLGLIFVTFIVGSIWYGLSFLLQSPAETSQSAADSQAIAFHNWIMTLCYALLVIAWYGPPYLALARQYQSWTRALLLFLGPAIILMFYFFGVFDGILAST